VVYTAAQKRLEEIVSPNFATHEEVLLAFKRSEKFLDVRAEIEFAKGTLPESRNCPILNDDERRLVGTSYKVDGSAAAVALGESLVQGRNRDIKVAAWLEFFRENPDGILFCFRGGMRSQYAQNWLKESGVSVRRIQGGYKRYRRFFIDLLETMPSERQFIVVSGRTGCGKTLLIRQIGSIENCLDLEDLARHRGSSFGNLEIAQPSQIDFENALAIALFRTDKLSKILIEDESRLIGRSCLPDSLIKEKVKAPVVYIEDPIEQRIERIYLEYVGQALLSQGAATLQASLQASLNRIKNRLGGVIHSQISSTIASAFAQADQSKSMELHRVWIFDLLQRYYDPLYEHHFAKKQDRILFRGEYNAVKHFLVAQLAVP
jgi:tRNA 2-selenouridine synthase